MNESPEIDLSEFEMRTRVRELVPSDHAAVVALQLRCFPKMDPWTREQFESQIRIFPAGQLCVEIDGRICASSASLIVDYANYAEWHDWMVMSDGGFIRNHDPKGDSLYGIEMMVDPEFRGMRLARRLYEERKRLVREHNLARMLIGGRIPGYREHKGEMSAHEYVDRVMSKRNYDPVLTTQLANGFVLKQLVPDYLPNDEDSAGYATCLEWPNLDYVPPRYMRERRAVASVRIGLVQYQMRAISSFEEFEKQCEFFVDVGSDYKADFLLFPELFTVQLLSLVKPDRPGSAARALSLFTPRYLELMTTLAVKYHVNIIGGSQFTEEGGDLFNVSYLFRRDGTIGKQYKIHVTPNERKWWGVTGGDQIEAFDTDRGRIAICICYDIEFPELCRIAVQKGAQILFVPFNTNDRYGYQRVRICAQARCIENHVYVATAGCVGNLPMVENADIHYAQSGIFTPSDVAFARDGVATECSPNLEAVVVHDVDTELLRRHRMTGTVQNWNDRRVDLYRVAYHEGDGGTKEV